jgi:ABC-type transport system involved in multi-copper enzyme maturation permease subunit
MTTMSRLVRGEIRKLTTTKLPWGFLLVLLVIAGLDAAIVAFATETDGSKAFVATAADQQSLMAFASNAMIGTSLFGAIAVAREYGHRTVVPMFLTSPNRTRAVLAQLAAVMLGGAILALIGQALVVVGVALAMPSTSHSFLVPAGNLAQLFAATTLAGAAGAILGAGLGALIRNIGGAVTTAILVVFVIPPLVAQMFTDAGSWIPTSLFAVISGVSPEVSVWAAVLAIGGWALIPAAAGLAAIQRRDVV